MRIIFVRHGDPDYEHDTLTEKGHREAALLGKLAPELHSGRLLYVAAGKGAAYR